MPGMFYAMCQVDVPPEEPPQDSPGKRVLAPHRIHENPPAELIVLPISASLEAFKHAVAASYRDMYYAFRDFKVFCPEATLTFFLKHLNSFKIRGSAMPPGILRFCCSVAVFVACSWTHTD